MASPSRIASQRARPIGDNSREPCSYGATSSEASTSKDGDGNRQNEHKPQKSDGFIPGIFVRSIGKRPMKSPKKIMENGHPISSYSKDSRSRYLDLMRAAMTKERRQNYCTNLGDMDDEDRPHAWFMDGSLYQTQATRGR